MERAKAQAAEVVQIEDSKRVRILQFIKANPGTHLRKIKRELNLAMGVIQYHLYRLERERSVVSARHGLYKRYYADQGPRIEERAIVNVLFQETERDLILYLLENPRASQKELSQFARISPSSTNWHMKRLSQAGFVEARRERGFVVYTVKGDPGMILSLLRSYHPRIWDKWAERLADLMT